jgi:hypothetical protein
MKALKTQADYAAALARIEALMGATPDSPEEAELADLVDEYEQTHDRAIAPHQWSLRSLPRGANQLSDDVPTTPEPPLWGGFF